MKQIAMGAVGTILMATLALSACDKKVGTASTAPAAGSGSAAAKPADPAAPAAPATPAVGSGSAAAAPAAPGTPAAPAAPVAIPADVDAMAQQALTQMEKLADAISSNAKDCKKMAAAITKFGIDNKDLNDKMKALNDKTSPEVKAALGKKYEAQATAFSTKAAPALEACAQDPDVMKAMQSMQAGDEPKGAPKAEAKPAAGKDAAKTAPPKEEPEHK